MLASSIVSVSRSSRCLTYSPAQPDLVGADEFPGLDGGQDRGEGFLGGGEQVQTVAARPVEFYNYPAEHWIHLRTTNPIESTFSTVRLRTKVTKGPGSRMAGLAMAFKLIEAAQGRWRAVNAPHLVALVRAGATFCKGKLVERPTDEDAEVMVA